jgi:hypothetical protein
MAIRKPGDGSSKGGFRTRSFDLGKCLLPNLDKVWEILDEEDFTRFMNLRERGASDRGNILREGMRIVEEVLTPHGFRASVTAEGQSSWGAFARGEFRRGDRWIEGHFRHSLGLVAYHLGQAAISHEDYMWAVVGRPRVSHYPGFSSDPLDGFRHLAQDLAQYARDFLSGSDEEILRNLPVVEDLKPNQPRLP